MRMKAVNIGMVYALEEGYFWGLVGCGCDGGTGAWVTPFAKSGGNVAWVALAERIASQPFSLP